MDISNRALAMFLLAAIVVSLAGTLTSLNKLGSISTTGYATTDTGTVQLTVASSVSVILDNDTIDFGTCTPYVVKSVVINSEDGGNTSGVNGICTYPTKSNFSIRNDGNVDANISMQASDVGENAGGGSFLASAEGSSDIAYKAFNGSEIAGMTGGCSKALRTVPTWTSYINLTSTSVTYPVCANLTWGATGANSLTHNYQLVIPKNVPPGADSVTITYTAATI